MATKRFLSVGLMIYRYNVYSCLRLLIRINIMDLDLVQSCSHMIGLLDQDQMTDDLSLYFKLDLSLKFSFV